MTHYYLLVLFSILTYGQQPNYNIVDGKKTAIHPESYEIRNDKLYLFYKTLINNTYNKWVKKNPKLLITKADNNWIKI